MYPLFSIPVEIARLTVAGSGSDGIKNKIVIPDAYSILWPELPEYDISCIEFAPFVGNILHGDAFSLFSLFGWKLYKDVSDEWFQIRNAILSIKTSWQFKTTSFLTLAEIQEEIGCYREACHILALGCDYNETGEMSENLSSKYITDDPGPDFLKKIKERFIKTYEVSSLPQEARAPLALRRLCIAEYVKTMQNVDREPLNVTHTDLLINLDEGYQETEGFGSHTI